MEKLRLDFELSAEARAIALGRAIAEIAGRQYGVISRKQLAALGLGHGAIDWRLRTGRLRRVHRSVYADGHAPLSPRGRWLAAVLAAGPGAVLSHGSAAALWGLRRQNGPVEVTARSGRQGRSRPGGGVRLHRCALESIELASKDGIPVTSVARTLLDLAGSHGLAAASRAWEEADRLRILRQGEVERLCVARAGRRGIRAIRVLLRDARAPASARSPLEERFLSFCEQAGLPAPATNVLVLGHEVDALWPSARLAVELDSWEFHSHRKAFERDRARDVPLQIAGYRIVRVTHRRIDDEPRQLASELRALLGA